MKHAKTTKMSMILIILELTPAVHETKIATRALGDTSTAHRSRRSG